MKLKKTSLLFLMIFSLVLGACSQTAQQPTESRPGDAPAEKKQEGQQMSDFPTKPIELIVPTPPGGSNDTVARVLAKVAQKYLPNGQSVVVVNKPGGGNTIGILDVFNAKADGYTIGFAPSFTLTVNPHYGNVPYTHDSFQTIMRVLQLPGFMYVKGDAPWQSFDELLDYIKQNPEQFSAAVAVGNKSLLERINTNAGIQMKIVPYDGSAPAMAALLGGHVQATIGSMIDAKSHIEAGTIRPIIGTSGRRVSDVPLLKEKGIGVEVNQLMGIIAPKGIKDDVLAILHDAFKQALEDQEVTEQLQKIGLEAYYGSSADFQKDLSDNFKMDGEALKQVGLIK